MKADDEAADLIKIRNWYLPEIVLAYNAVLCAAAHMISRDHLLRSMELANDVANDKTGLAECFMESGRMPQQDETERDEPKQAGEKEQGRQEPGNLGDISLRRAFMPLNDSLPSSIIP